MQSKEGRVILAHGLAQVQSLMVGKEYQQKHEVTGHTESAVRKQGEKKASISLLSPFYPVRHPCPWNTRVTHD